MISVVCVYNDAEVLEKRLLRSLKTQTAAYELVTVDNRNGRFRSAAEALNYGAGKTTQEWVMFVHQDISFLSTEWFAKAEQTFQEFQPTGWVGVVGMTKQGALRGFLIDIASLRGAAFDAPIEIQTLDECLLIHRRKQDNRPYFDTGLRGWHAYGVEACCQAIIDGCSNYVISLPVWHDSKATNLQGLEEAHEYVWRKHGGAFHRIFTTCGPLPDLYKWRDDRQFPHLRRVKMWGREKALRFCGFPTRYVYEFDEALEKLTENLPIVEVLHKAAPYDVLEAKSFLPVPKQERRVIHRFCGFDYGDLQSECVVVMPELATELLDYPKEWENLVNKIPRLLVCVNIEDFWRRPKLWRKLKSQSAKQFIVQKVRDVINWDGKSWTTVVFAFDKTKKLKWIVDGGLAVIEENGLV